MTDRDQDALDALIADLAQTERAAYERGLGEGILAAVEDANKRRTDKGDPVLDRLQAAYREREGDHQE